MCGELAHAKSLADMVIQISVQHVAADKGLLRPLISCVSTPLPTMMAAKAPLCLDQSRGDQLSYCCSSSLYLVHSRCTARGRPQSDRRPSLGRPSYRQGGAASLQDATPADNAHGGTLTPKGNDHG